MLRDCAPRPTQRMQAGADRYACPEAVRIA